MAYQVRRSAYLSILNPTRGMARDYWSLTVRMGYLASETQGALKVFFVGCLTFGVEKGDLKAHLGAGGKWVYERRLWRWKWRRA